MAIAMRAKPKKSLGAKASCPNASMDALVRLLSTRERSVNEAQKRLAEKGFEDKAVADTIERALGCGLLDDQRFARSYIRGKLSSGWGKRRIERELYFFGIDTERLEGYPDEYFSDEEQLERALSALKKHHSRSKNPRQAAYRFLVGKGYSSDIASAAIRHWEAEQSSSQEE